MHRIAVGQIMQRSVLTIQPEALVVDAEQLLEEFKIRRLPVVDADNYLVGIVTDADLREAEAASKLVNSYDPTAGEQWLTVGDVMSREVVTITEEATIGELAEVLMLHKVGGLPVVETDSTAPRRLRLIGIVTETDIFRLIAEAWQAEQAAQTV